MNPLAGSGPERAGWPPRILPAISLCAQLRAPLGQNPSRAMLLAMAAESAYQTRKSHPSFGGRTLFAEHPSSATGTSMRFSAFLPKEVQEIDSAIIWLSGLTCNEENFITKAGAQALLAGSSTMVICPDTSPRGLELPGEHDSYDFGSGAGFYVNATTEGYCESYRMYDYITQDLVALLDQGFGVRKLAIMGHSMGGHGALTIALREPQTFRSVSAFSPIVNPIEAPWGQRAFRGYLGEDPSIWAKHDTCALLKAGHKAPSKILIEQGQGDEFLEKELLTANFENAAQSSGQPYQVNYRPDYDHSYYFIASFLKEHIEFHLAHLK